MQCTFYVYLRVRYLAPTFVLGCLYIFQEKRNKYAAAGPALIKDYIVAKAIADKVDDD
jgi:hypothetical protein